MSSLFSHRDSRAAPRTGARGDLPTWVVPAAHLLLLAWIALGGAHTAISMARQGLRGTTPPAVGLRADEAVEDIEILQELLPSHEDATVLIAFPPSADLADMDYVRFQLAHLRYPMRMYGAMASETGPLVESGPPGPERRFDFVVTRRGSAPPEGWEAVGRRGVYSVWAPATP